MVPENEEEDSEGEVDDDEGDPEEGEEEYEEDDDEYSEDTTSPEVLDGEGRRSIAPVFGGEETGEMLPAELRTQKSGVSSASRRSRKSRASVAAPAPGRPLRRAVKTNLDIATLFNEAEGFEVLRVYRFRVNSELQEVTVTHTTEPREWQVILNGRLMAQHKHQVYFLTAWINETIRLHFPISTERGAVQAVHSIKWETQYLRFKHELKVESTQVLAVGGYGRKREPKAFLARGPLPEIGDGPRREQWRGSLLPAEDDDEEHNSDAPQQDIVDYVVRGRPPARRELQRMAALSRETQSTQEQGLPADQAPPPDVAKQIVRARRRESEDKMWGVLKESYKDSVARWDPQGGSDSDYVFESITDQDREWLELHRRPASKGLDPSEVEAFHRRMEIPTVSRWLRDFERGLQQRRLNASPVPAEPSSPSSARSKARHLQPPATPVQTSPAERPLRVRPDGETWRWTARIANLRMHELGSDELAELVAALQSALSDVLAIPQAHVAVALTPASSAVTAHLCGAASVARQLRSSEGREVLRSRLLSMPLVLRASTGRASLVDEHICQLPSEEMPSFSEDSQAVFKIMRTHNTSSLLGLDAKPPVEDSAIIANLAETKLPETLLPMAGSNAGGADAVERVDHHIWQLSSEYESLVALAFQRRRLADPSSAPGDGASLLAVRKACDGLQAEELTPDISAVLAPAAAREMEVAEAKRAVEEARHEVSSLTRRVGLLAQECTSLHGEVRQLRSHRDLELEEAALEKECRDLQAELDAQSSLEVQLMKERRLLEAREDQCTTAVQYLQAELEGLRQQLHRPVSESTATPMRTEFVASPGTQPRLTEVPQPGPYASVWHDRVGPRMSYSSEGALSSHSSGILLVK